MTLQDFLVSEIFAFMMAFCRVGSAVMLLPGFGEAYISARYRLVFAVMFSLVVAPIIPSLPELPATILGLLPMLFAEILSGLFIGTIARLMIAATSIAGMIIAYQASLASAIVQDVTTVGAQGSSMGNLVGLTALVLIFSMDLHHLMLRAIHDSYLLFSPGIFPPIADMTQQITRTVNTAMFIALQLSAPHIVIGLIIYLAGGILARLMPSLQVFFVLQPIQIVLSFAVLMVVFQAMMEGYMEHFSNSISQFVGP